MPDVVGSADRAQQEQEGEAIVVTSRIVACDGGGGPLGHPRVFLHIESEGSVVCPYCSRFFVLADGADTGLGH